MATEAVNAESHEARFTSGFCVGASQGQVVSPSDFADAVAIFEDDGVANVQANRRAALTLAKLKARAGPSG